MKPARLKALVGTNVKNARERLGLSQEALAEAANLSSYQSISNIERGKSLPPLNTLFAIAAAVGVPAPDLLSPDGLPDNGPRAALIAQAQTMLADLDDRELETALKVVRALWEGRG